VVISCPLCHIYLALDNLELEIYVLEGFNRKLRLLMTFNLELFKFF
jgi:hypothetical protein